MRSDKWFFIYTILFLFIAITKTESKQNNYNSPSEGPVNHPVYEQLRSALERYEEIAKNGGFPEVPYFKGVLDLNDTSDVVPDIRKRLTVTEDISEEAGKSNSKVYDEDVALAVGKFQKRHGIKVDGLTGPTTLQYMNKPVEDKIDKIEFSLNSWRDLPKNLGDKYVFVNIPDYKLTAYNNKEKQFDMRVVVGKEYDGRETPSFNDQMTYIEFNPYWNIPKSIVERTMLPQARQDISYLEKNNYEIVDRFDENAQVYENTQENLDLVEEERLHLRQKPGPRNAMGQMKFMFPNKYAIYLHDTPQDHLFHANERTFSNGCIRVEEPVKLAEFLLKNNSTAPGYWNRQRILQEVNQNETSRIYLDERIPVYIIYSTAFADEEGTIHFRDDIYDENT